MQPVWHLGTTTRPDTSSAFGEPFLWGALETPRDDFSPSATGDGLVLYFESVRSDAWRIYVTKRRSVSEGFPAATPLPNVEAGAGGPYVLPDDSALYFHSNNTGNGDLYRMGHANGSFGEAVALAGVNTGSIENFPVVSPDELTLYFQSDRLGGSGGSDIWMSTRSSKDEDFGPAEPLTSVNSEGYDIPTWVSPNGCRLYFESGTGGFGWVNIQLFVAERQ